MIRNIVIFLATLAVSALAGVLFTYPLAGAIICPSCYGFEAAGSNAFVEVAMPQPRRAVVASILDKASAQVHNFYGETLRKPHIFICETEDCYRYFAGYGSRGTAFLDRALILAPDGATVTIAAHELSHIELHARLGLWATIRGLMPRWFDEGLAVNVSEDPRYLKPGLGAARCLARIEGPLPATRHDWFVQADDRLYAAAACRVAEWLAAHGGNAAAAQLAGRIAQGEPFDAALR